MLARYGQGLAQTARAAGDQPFGFYAPPRTHYIGADVGRERADQDC